MRGLESGPCRRDLSEQDSGAVPTYGDDVRGPSDAGEETRERTNNDLFGNPLGYRQKRQGVWRSRDSCPNGDTDERNRRG